jgi:hypothetical protein
MRINNLKLYSSRVTPVEKSVRTSLDLKKQRDNSSPKHQQNKNNYESFADIFERSQAYYDNTEGKKK